MANISSIRLHNELINPSDLSVSNSKKSQMAALKTVKSVAIFFSAIATILTGHLGLDLSKKLIRSINNNNQGFLFKHLDKTLVNKISDEISQFTSLKGLSDYIIKIASLNNGDTYSAMTLLSKNSDLKEVLKEKIADLLIKDINNSSSREELDENVKAFKSLYGIQRIRHEAINRAIDAKSEKIANEALVKENARVPEMISRIENAQNFQELRNIRRECSLQFFDLRSLDQNLQIDKALTQRSDELS